MESLSIGISSSPNIPNHPKTRKPTSKLNFLLSNPLLNSISTSNSTPNHSNSHKSRFPFTKKIPLTPQSTLIHQSNQITTPQSSSKPSKNNNPIPQNPSLFQFLPIPPLPFLSVPFSFPLSCLASETTLPNDPVSNKINVEAILVSIDDFFNRYPFFVSGVVFIWLVVIPLTEEYLQKHKFISAINAFKKLKEDPNAQLLDIRAAKSLGFLGSPNLRILKKSVVQVEFIEGDEEGFVKNTLEKFRDPANTTICILDNFDGNSIEVAELLVKKGGFKEAYAIDGGIRGKNGWLDWPCNLSAYRATANMAFNVHEYLAIALYRLQDLTLGILSLAIQETLLPPSVHIFPKRRAKKSQQFETNGGANQQKSADNDQLSSVAMGEKLENGYVNKSIEPTPEKKHDPRSLFETTFFSNSVEASKLIHTDSITLHQLLLMDEASFYSQEA
ncbi:hypothetical protein LguiA_011825 [Lonicera macranthoides]